MDEKKQLYKKPEMVLYGNLRDITKKEKTSLDNPDDTDLGYST